MSDYTPTTDDLRLAYENHRGLCLAETMRDQGESFIPGVEAGEDFDRWLAAHDAEVAAKTLDDAANEMDSTLRYPDSPSFNAAAHNANRATAAAADHLRGLAAGIRGTE